MRDSRKKKERESDYPGGKEEAEINREKTDRKGKVDCIALSNKITSLLSAQMFLLIALCAR